MASGIRLAGSTVLEQTSGWRNRGNIGIGYYWWNNAGIARGRRQDSLHLSATNTCTGHRHDTGDFGTPCCPNIQRGLKFAQHLFKSLHGTVAYGVRSKQLPDR